MALTEEQIQRIRQKAGYTGIGNGAVPVRQPIAVQQSSTKAGKLPVAGKAAVGFGDFMVGIAKGFGQRSRSIGSLIGKTRERTVDKLPTGKAPINPLSPFGVIDAASKVVSKAPDLISKELVTAKNKAQQAGVTTQQIGEFFIPGTAPTKAARAISGTRAISALGGLGRLGSRAATEAVAAAPIAALQDGKEEAKRTAKFAAAVPVVTGSLGAVGRGLGRLATEALGKTTGAGTAAIKAAFESPEVMRYARLAGKKGSDEVLEDSLRTAKTGLQKLRTDRGKAYESQLGQLKMNSAFVESKLKPVLRNTKQSLNDVGDDLETIVEGRAILDKAAKDVRGWTDTTAKGLDRLKKRLASYERQLNAPGRGSAKRIVSMLKNDVRKGLEKNVDGYKKLTADYAKASSLIDEVEKALSLGDKKNKETAIRKLLQTVRRDDDSRRELLRAASKAAGVDIERMISGTLLSSTLPRGLSGSFSSVIGPVGLGASIVNPQFWAALIPYAAASSPRLVGDVATIAGALRRVGPEGLSPQLERLIRQTLISIQEDL